MMKLKPSALVLAEDPLRSGLSISDADGVAVYRWLRACRTSLAGLEAAGCALLLAWVAEALRGRPRPSGSPGITWATAWLGLCGMALDACTADTIAEVTCDLLA